MDRTKTVRITTSRRRRTASNKAPTIVFRPNTKNETTKSYNNSTDITSLSDLRRMSRISERISGYMIKKNVLVNYSNILVRYSRCNMNDDTLHDLQHQLVNQASKAKQASNPRLTLYCTGFFAGKIYVIGNVN